MGRSWQTWIAPFHSKTNILNHHSKLQIIHSSHVGVSHKERFQEWMLQRSSPDKKGSINKSIVTWDAGGTRNKVRASCPLWTLCPPPWVLTDCPRTTFPLRAGLLKILIIQLWALLGSQQEDTVSVFTFTPCVFGFCSRQQQCFSFRSWELLLDFICDFCSQKRCSKNLPEKRDCGQENEKDNQHSEEGKNQWKPREERA